MLGHSTLTDFLQFLILIPLGLGFVLLVPLFLLCVVSVHHLFIWCLREINNWRWATKWSKSSPNSQSCTQFNPWLLSMSFSGPDFQYCCSRWCCCCWCHSPAGLRQACNKTTVQVMIREISLHSSLTFWQYFVYMLTLKFRAWTPVTFET